MPELVEVERYRRLAELALERRIAEVSASDAWFLKGTTADDVVAALTGASFTAARRIGKLLLLDLRPLGGERDDLPPTVLGLRFGMTGRLLVDGAAGVGDLLYSSVRDEPAWDRFGVRFEDGGSMVVRDPRRLGGVLLDPEVTRLGVEASTVTEGQLRRVLDGSRAPLKARLLDQGRLAGVGNLIADEVLFRSALDPGRAAGSLSGAETRRLARHLRSTVADLDAGGGSHTGRLQPARSPGGACPRDGTPLQRRTIGGRTTWSCPAHQR